MREKWVELLAHYFGDLSSVEIKDVPFGLTNDTKIVVVNGINYVARLYNPHTKNLAGMELETSISSFLAHNNLSFQVPEFLPTLRGELYVRLKDGTLAAVTKFLEGKPPALVEIRHAHALGSVAGELSALLSRFRYEDHAGVPFTELYRLHPLADSHAVQAFMSEPPFEITEQERRFYDDMLEVAVQGIVRLKALPKAFVHHDVLVFNLLARNDMITAVLDFDLMSRDVGFFEFVICFNHVLQMTDGSPDMAEAFANGYAKFKKFTRAEVRELQLLTQIYHLAVLHFYIGQHYAGRVIEPSFKYILNQFRVRNDWLDDYREEVDHLISSCLLEG